MYRYPDAALLVFCKAPVPGQVKTRLTPPLTPEQCAQLHCELTGLTLQNATRNALCPVQLWCAPSVSHPYFQGLAQTYPVELKQQLGDDLGERMHHAFCTALTRFSHVVIVGCDCPSLTSADLENAVISLTTDVDCVLAPAEDGGYVVIGLNHPQPALFVDIPWGSPEVFAKTEAKIGRLGLKTRLLNSQWDVDTYEDYQKYRKLFASNN